MKEERGADLGSVSYTHLDVYKRQTNTCTKILTKQTYLATVKTEKIGCVVFTTNEDT